MNESKIYLIIALSQRPFSNFLLMNLIDYNDNSFISCIHNNLLYKIIFMYFKIDDLPLQCKPFEKQKKCFHTKVLRCKIG